jgi:hypothetical protein
MRQVVHLSALCIARFYAFGLFFVESQVIVVRHDISLTHFLRKVRAIVRFSNQGLASQSRKNRGCLSLISNMENQFLAISAVLKKLPKKVQL